MAKIAKKIVGDNSVTFSFSNGKDIVAKLSELPEEIVHRLALHGLSQKGGDSYASADSIGTAVANLTEVVGNLRRGIWATKATGGKLAEALQRATGQPLEDCIAKLQGMDDKAKADLRKHPQIKLAIAQIDAENAAKVAETIGDETGEDLSDMFN